MEVIYKFSTNMIYNIFRISSYTGFQDTFIFGFISFTISLELIILIFFF